MAGVGGCAVQRPWFGFDPRRVVIAIGTAPEGRLVIGGLFRGSIQLRTVIDRFDRPN